MEKKIKIAFINLASTWHAQPSGFSQVAYSTFLPFIEILIVCLRAGKTQVYFRLDYVKPHRILCGLIPGVWDLFENSTPGRLLNSTYVDLHKLSDSFSSVFHTQYEPKTCIINLVPFRREPGELLIN